MSPTEKPRLRPEKRKPRRKCKPVEDTIVGNLSPEDRERLGVDAWEPSLLRELLSARKTKSRG